MHVDLGIWDKLTRVVMVLLLVAGMLAVAVLYLPLIRTNERLRAHVLKLEEQKQVQERTARELKSSIDALRHDPKAFERLARERLNLMKPGETIVVFEPPLTNPAAVH